MRGDGFSEVANFAEQIYFVGRIVTSQSHVDDGDWPSGKAVDSGSTIGVKIACGCLQGNLSDFQLVESRKVSGSPKVTRIPY